MIALPHAYNTFVEIGICDLGRRHISPSCRSLGVRGINTHQLATSAEAEEDVLNIRNKPA